MRGILYQIFCEHELKVHLSKTKLSDEGGVAVAIFSRLETPNNKLNPKT